MIVSVKIFVNVFFFDKIECELLELQFACVYSAPPKITFIKRSIYGKSVMTDKMDS